MERFANDSTLIDAFQRVLAIHFEHECERFFEVLTGLDVATLFGRFEHCGERLRHDGEVNAYFHCMRRLAATAIVLLAVPLYADSLADMRAAVAQLRATKPIHVSMDVQRSRMNEGRFANSQFTGSASLDALEDESGLHLTFSRAILERAERESRERTSDPRKTTPTRNAIDEMQTTDVADAVDFARPFLRLIETAVKVSESRGVREGRPVRIIVLKLTRKLPPEAASIFSVKFTEDQMTVWLGDDNIPVAAERIQRGTAGFMFIKGSMMNRSFWNFARYADRLVVLRSDISYAGSGFGQKGEGRSAQVVTVR